MHPSCARGGSTEADCNISTPFNVLFISLFVTRIVNSFSPRSPPPDTVPPTNNCQLTDGTKFESLRLPSSGDKCHREAELEMGGWRQSDTHCIHWSKQRYPWITISHLFPGYLLALQIDSFSVFLLVITKTNNDTWRRTFAGSWSLGAPREGTTHWSTLHRTPVTNRR